MVNPNTQPGEPAAVGEAADGWVRIELDNSGRVRDVALSPQAMTMTAEQLSKTLAAAFRQAQDVARASAESATAQYGSLPSRERLEAAAEEATLAAERRFGEVSAVLYGLERRAEREW